MNITQRYLVHESAEDYEEGRISRRELLTRALWVTGSVAGAAAALRQVGRTNASTRPAGAAASRRVRANVALSAAPSVATDDPGVRTLPPTEVTDRPVVAADAQDIVARQVTFPGEAGQLFGYLAYPVQGGPFPALIINPDNFGLAEPNLDIARRYAREGYVALVVDLASRMGGTAAVVASGMNLLRAIGPLSDAARLADMTAGIEYLKQLPVVDSARGFGTTGFCYGGNQTFLLAIGNPDIRVAVTHYGMVQADQLSTTSVAVLAFYGEDDTFVTPQAPAVEAALQAAGTAYQIVIYPGAGHAFFFNPDNRYRPEAARDAWLRTLSWLNEHL